ncbi:hypothetical protein FRB95_010107 [Tulasnella sp. JGI-2019a]|nr:hypothetical protein FRB93_006404 [Tulasnella sp. JGI-2019a]KAG9025473.1 hypothetical protein FRB95_010107 [Tulasnella sp. JGI-2019a]
MDQDDVQQSLASSAICPNGVYISPTADSAVDLSRNLTILWDPSCFTADTAMQVDLFRDRSLMHEWTVDNSSTGHLSVNVDPNWWANTTTSNQANATFYLNIIPQSSVETFSPGPTFTVTGAITASSAHHSNLDFNKLTKPQLIALIIAPTLVVIIIGAVIYAIVRSRENTARERRAWMEGIRPITRY